MKNFYNFKSTLILNRDAQLLLEVLIAVAVSAAVILLGSQLVFVSLESNKYSGEKNVATGLAEESLEAVRSISVEQWQNIYDASKNTNYYPVQSSGAWTFATGTESVNLDNFTYSRYFIIQNTCRDLSTSTKAITGISDANGTSTTCATNGGSHDPSTQKITVTVTSPSEQSISSSEYLTRWRNRVCDQTAWTSTGGGVANCSDSTYTSASSITTGASLELCSGC